MDFLLAPIDVLRLEAWDTSVNDLFFVAALVFLVPELGRYALRGRLSRRVLGDVVTNFITFALSMGLTYVLLGGLYLVGFAAAATLAPVALPVNGLTLAACLLLADFAYYWEHRFSHRVGVAWGTHSVHHSSPYFNLSVASRFGPLDGLFPFLFHLPLVLVGFDPLLVLFAESMVLAYQTWLHTEAIGTLPRPIEWLFNTPSHHRAHHGSNERYLDTNYGGVLIVWDRLFGTFAEEREEVVFGLTEPLEKDGPVWAFLHGYVRLFRRMRAMPRWTDKLRVWLAPPSWTPER